MGITETAGAIDLHAHWTPGSALAACARSEPWHGIEMGRTADGLPTAVLSGKTVTFASSDLHFSGLDARVPAMDLDEVEVQVLSLLPQLFGYDQEPSAAARYCAAVNDELAEELRSGPTGRFLGLGAVPLGSPAGAVVELRRCVEELGLAGIAVGTNVRGSRWASDELWPLLEAAEALRAVVFLHPNAPSGYPIPDAYRLRNVFGNPADTTIVLQVLAFSGALERFPGLRLVAAHGGGYTAMALGRMEHSWRMRSESKARATISPREALANVTVDTVVHSPEGLRFIVEAFGADNVVVGTDFPADMGLASPTTFVREAFADDPHIADQVLNGNARRLLDARDAVVPA